MNTIELIIIEVLNFCHEFLKQLSEHIIYAWASFWLLFIFTKLIVGKLIPMYRKKQDYNNLKVKFDYNGNDIQVDIVNFDGYNYIFRLNVDAFDAIPGGPVIIRRQEYAPYIIHMSREDISFYDIIKITMLKNIKLTEKTASNIIRILMNNKIIH